MKLAFSFLCEHPGRRTGLTTLFRSFITEARRQDPSVEWVIFAGAGAFSDLAGPGVEVVEDFSANDRRLDRLWADHFLVGPAARRRGAAALLTVGFMPLRTGGLPVVMHVFTVPPRRGGGLGAAYRRAAMARGLRHAALVIANSQWTAAQLRALAPVVVSHEGLDSAVFQPAGPTGIPGLPSGYLLWVSNFYPYKRAELVLAAYARLSRELRSRHPLVLAGGDWEGGRARAEAEAQRLGLGSDTRFVGWVDDADLPTLYRGARVLVSATAEETFGRNVTEALACGCPCVLQDLAVLREVAGPAACFVDFTDSAAAGESLRQICTDDAQVARLRTQGIEWAKRYSYSRLVRQRLTAILRLPLSPS
ncbi:MAG: glycosyltransferase family 4 protein [Verrucomicrobia bacterium]|nr:glycosyltransferase family 4 protein [Verrucomicrobiota bacterium]